LFERHAFERADFACIASMGLVADRYGREVDAFGKLLGDLGDNVGEGSRGLDREPKLALFANESKNHGAYTLSDG
jgi:hypothetical protein